MDKEKLARDAFNSTSSYYQVMTDWHKMRDGVAIEEEMKTIIQGQCKYGARILEAGSGEGSISLWFAARNPNVNFIGVDISQIGISMAKARSLSNTEFYVADLKQIPEQDNSVDFIFSQSVIEHVVNWEVSVREMYRVLKKNGSLLIRVENGGIRGKSLWVALRDYLFFRNHVVELNPSFKMDVGDIEAQQNNFDVQEIPSDVLVRVLKAYGVKIQFFSTRTHRYLIGSHGVQAFILWALSHLNFWPFNHLGPTIIVLAQKV